MSLIFTHHCCLTYQLAVLHIHCLLLLLQIKCRSTLRISGLVPSAYWCGQAAVDIPFYYLILSCMCITLFSLHTGNLLTSSNLSALVSVIHFPCHRF